VIPSNLKEQFSDRYRVVLDESADGEPGAKSDPWNFIIPARYGSIYPFSDVLLAFHCKARGIRTRLSKDHSEILVRNWSDDGDAIFLFRPDQFKLVAEYARPKRRRRLSPDHRKKLVKAGSRSLESYRDSNSNFDPMAPESMIPVPVHTSGQGGGF
jgi:hypothetical protein